jgi:hypothetical protein
MFTLIAQIFEWLRPATQEDGDFAHHLMERAEARAGLDPRQAQELRSAARAYLSVVR